jgi:hypothetical protein
MLPQQGVHAKGSVPIEGKKGKSYMPANVEAFLIPHVARMSEAISGEQWTRISLRSCGLPERSTAKLLSTRKCRICISC